MVSLWAIWCPLFTQILTQIQTGTSGMAPPCPDKQSEFINSRCLPGNPSHDQILAKTSLTQLSTLCAPTHQSALWVTALNAVGPSLRSVKKCLPSDTSPHQGHLQPSRSVSWFPHPAGCLPNARRAPESKDLDSQWHTHSQIPPRYTPTGVLSVIGFLAGGFC